MQSDAQARPTKLDRQERKRQEVMRAAAKFFNKKGFHQTSLDEIGETLGLTKAALYYYFPNKSSLLAACFSRAMELAASCLDQAQRECPDGRSRLIRFFMLYIVTSNEELDHYFLLTEDSALEPQQRTILVGWRDRIEIALRQLVAEGIKDGSIVPCDPKLAVFLMLGSVNWIPKWFSAAGPWSPVQLATATAEMLDRMLSAAPSTVLARDVGQISIARDHGGKAPA